MTGGPCIDHYDWPGGRETLLRFGSGRPRVFLSLPLFEEYNRTRVFGVTLLRALADRGIGGLLPDWPGTGDSIVPTRDATLAAMRAACGALVAAHPGIVGLSIRSGALIDGDAPVAGRWQLSPISGTDLARELDRQTSADGTIAGNRIARTLLDALIAAQPGAARIVRHDSDPRPADLTLAGSPLWRRAEPGNDPDLAARLADDIATWIDPCAG